MSDRWYHNGEPVEPEPFDPFELVVIAVNVGFGVMRAFSKGAGTLAYSLKAHVNYRAEQREWQNRLVNEIEKL